MTATSQGRRVITTHPCPSWCEDDLPCGPSEVLHCLDLPDTWGAADPFTSDRLRLGLERQDDQDGVGLPHISVQLAAGQAAHSSISLPVDAGPDLALATLRLAARASGTNTVLLLRDLLARELETQQGPTA